MQATRISGYSVAALVLPRYSDCKQSPQQRQGGCAPRLQAPSTLRKTGRQDGSSKGLVFPEGENFKRGVH